MPSKDLHKEPFTEETITKLDIFEKYAKTWLPVFIYSNFNEVYICDFFAGPGKDVKGNIGSPFRILNIVGEYQKDIIQRKFKVNILLNEYDKRKFSVLENYIINRLDTMKALKDFININLNNIDFQKLFDTEKKKLQKTANLIFLDQNGIKQVSESVLLDLDKFARTDFMFFISSSFFNRFQDEFKKFFPHSNSKVIKDANYLEIHRIILNEYKKMLPAYSKTKLYPFSIKKGSNIYGLIFGTKHPLAIDKFLRIAWDKNKLNGEANFDINEDAGNMQGVLFQDMKHYSKRETFEIELEKFIMDKQKITNKEIYDFTLESGHLPQHAIKKVKELKKEGLLKYFDHINISYNKCYKENEIKIFEVLKSEKI